MSKNFRSKTVAIIGAGYLGRSIIDGLLKKGHRKIIATRRNKKELMAVQKKYPSITTTHDNRIAATRADVIIIAAKETSFATISTQIKEFRKNKLTISMGPTYTLGALRSQFGKRTIRMMTPIYPRCDVVCYCTNKSCAKSDEAMVRYIFGDYVTKISEKDMPVATAFVCLRGTLNSLVDPLLQVGTKHGMKKELIRSVVGNMLKSLGEEIALGSSAKQRLEGASGGFNKKSFTLRLNKRLAVVQDTLLKEMEKLTSEFVTFSKK